MSKHLKGLKKFCFEMFTSASAVDTETVMEAIRNS